MALIQPTYQLKQGLYRDCFSSGFTIGSFSSAHLNYLPFFYFLLFPHYQFSFYCIFLLSSCILFIFFLCLSLLSSLLPYSFLPKLLFLFSSNYFLFNSSHHIHFVFFYCFLSAFYSLPSYFSPFIFFLYSPYSSLTLSLFSSLLILISYYSCYIQFVLLLDLFYFSLSSFICSLYSLLHFLFHIMLRKSINIMSHF